MLFDLPNLSKNECQRLIKDCEVILQSQKCMIKKSGRNILHYTLGKKRKHIKYSHYPVGDRIDKITGAQYFYHCHRENYDSNEHGHFHCFIRYAQIPKSYKPKKLKDWDKYINNPMTHVVAIGMNQFGYPIRLFTVNRWVTSEIFYSANNMQKIFPKFAFTLQDDPYWMILDKWVSSIISLFSPQIMWLHKERDLILQNSKSCNKNINIYEDRHLEELSSIDIDLTQQINWVLEQYQTLETKLFLSEVD